MKLVTTNFSILSLTTELEAPKTMFELDDLPEEFRDQVCDIACGFESQLRKGKAVEISEILKDFDGLERDVLKFELNEIYRFHTSDLLRDQCIIDRYENLAVLGSGNFSTVYRCYDPATERDVAVKLIHESPLSSQFTFRSLGNEIEALGKLDSPHVVKIYDSGHQDSQAYIVMQLVDGETFKTWAPKVELGKRVLALAQIASGMIEVHENRILHRDIKPSNILIDAETERAYLADFGVAKIVDQTRTVEGLGNLVGSIGYLSPEQINGLDFLPQSDIFSFGLVLYEAVVGKSPFENCKHNSEIAAQAVAGSIRVPKDVDADLRSIIEKCLHVQPGDRYQSFRALVEDLNTWSRGGKPIASTERLKRFIWPSVWVAMILIGFFVFDFATGGAVWRGFRSDKPDQPGGNTVTSIPGDGSQLVLFETDPENADVRVYPLLKSGEPDGSKEIDLGQGRECKLDPGLYYVVVVKGNEFIEVIREVPKPGYGNSGTAVLDFKFVEGGVLLKKVRIVDAPEFETKISGFYVGKDEQVGAFPNWNNALQYAEDRGCILPSVALLKAAYGLVDDNDRYFEWTLTIPNEPTPTKKFLVAKPVIQNGNEGREEFRFSKLGHLSYRFARRLKPYSSN